MNSQVLNPPAAGKGRRAIPAATPARHTSNALYYWLLLAIFFEYARPGAFVPGIEAVKLNSLIPLGLFMVQFFAAGTRPWGQIYGDAAAKWLTAFVVIVMISVPLADVSLYAYTNFKKILGYYFMFIMIARIATTIPRLYGVFWALIIAHVFLLAMNPVVLLNPSVRSYITGGTFLGDGNDFSLSLCILVPFCLELAFAAKSKIMKIVIYAVLALLVMAVVASQSRGATLAAAAMLGYLWWASPRKMAVLAGLAVAGLGLLAYAPDAYFSRMNTISSYQEDGSAEGRIIAWKASLRMAADHPVFGVGSGNFPVAFGSRYQPKDRHMPWITAHSMYFLVLGELGITGLIIYGGAVFSNMAANRGVRKRVLAAPPEHTSELKPYARLMLLLTASAISFSVAGAFLSVAYYPHAFMLTGMLIAARALVRQRLAEVVPEAPVQYGRARRPPLPSPSPQSR